MTNTYTATEPSTGDEWQVCGFTTRWTPVTITLPRDQHGRYLRSPQYDHRAEYDGLGGVKLKLYAGPEVNHYEDPPPPCEATAAPETLGDVP